MISKFYFSHLICRASFMLYFCKLRTNYFESSGSANEFFTCAFKLVVIEVNNKNIDYLKYKVTGL